jgi:CubicO group peptidase (beta-lactamase class C family)
MTQREVANPEAAGFDAERLEAARALFLRQQASGRFPGGQLVVRRRGHLALDVATGLARGLRPTENEPAMTVTPSTRFAAFSASKPVIAVALAMLEERGLIDVQAPVARYFPEFAAHDKGALTVLDVLTHRAAVFTPELLSRPRDWGDERLVREALIAAKPRWPRGTFAYMPYEFGWILAEVVRGATGTPLSQFLRTELAADLPGLRFGATTDELPQLARTYWLSSGSVRVAGSDLSNSFERDNNLPEVLTAFIPAAGLVCTASDLAGFYEVLARGGVTRSGKRLLSAETLARYTHGGATAFDRSNRLPLRMGRGFLLGSSTPCIYGWWGTPHVFGHAGAFCTLAWADPTLDLAVAIVTNGNRGPFESLFRFAALGTALRRACR